MTKGTERDQGAQAGAAAGGVRVGVSDGSWHTSGDMARRGSFEHARGVVSGTAWCCCEASQVEELRTFLALRAAGPAAFPVVTEGEA